MTTNPHDEMRAIANDCRRICDRMSPSPPMPEPAPLQQTAGDAMVSTLTPIYLSAAFAAAFGIGLAVALGEWRAIFFAAPHAALACVYRYAHKDRQILRREPERKSLSVGGGSVGVPSK